MLPDSQSAGPLPQPGVPERPDVATGTVLRPRQARWPVVAGDREGVILWEDSDAPQRQALWLRSDRRTSSCSIASVYSRSISPDAPDDVLDLQDGHLFVRSVLQETSGELMDVCFSLIRAHRGSPARLRPSGTLVTLRK